MWSFCIWIGRMQKWICFGLVTTSDDVHLFVDAIRRELDHAQINCLLSSVFWTRLVYHWTLHLCPPESGVGCRRLVQLCSGAAAAYCTSRTESRSLSGSDTCPTSIFWADWVGFCVTDAGNTVTTRLNSFMSGWYLPKWFIILSTIALLLPFFNCNYVYEQDCIRLHTILIKGLKTRSYLLRDDTAWCCVSSDCSVEEREGWG